MCKHFYLEPMQAIKTKLKKVTATPKRRVIIFSILIFFIAVIASGAWYWNTHKKSILKNRLETAVQERSKGLYRIEYGKLEMDEIAGSLTVANTNLIYDSARYIDLEKQGMAPAFLINIHIPEINVTGVNTSRALIDNEIVGRKLEIKNPVINIIYTDPGKDSLEHVPPKKIFEQILGNLNLIQADTILISGAQINSRSQEIKKRSVEIRDVSMTLVDVKIDSISNADTTRMLFAKQVSITCGKLAWLSPNKFYNYIADSISINSASSHLEVKNFRVTPTMDENVFVNAIPVQDYRYDLSFGNIRMQNINMPQLFDERIIADSVLIGAASIKIYCDVATHSSKKTQVETYPLHIIEVIPFPVRVPKIILSDGFVEYKERSNITRQSGKIQFYSIYASISNVTNDKNEIAINNIMTADVRAMLLNKTPLKVNWHFYLLHPNGRFNVNGSLDAMDATLFNPITIPLGPTRMNKGNLNRLEFNLNGNDQAMNGQVKMLYDDLNIAMLEKDKGANELDRKSLQSTLANTLIINSNPRGNKNVRVVQAHFDRGINQSIFYISWQTLFKGMRETVGINQ